MNSTGLTGPEKGLYDLGTYFGRRDLFLRINEIIIDRF